jgi:hypothetical protein
MVASSFAICSHAMHLAQVPATPRWSRQLISQAGQYSLISIVVPVFEASEVLGLGYDIVDFADITLAKIPNGDCPLAASVLQAAFFACPSRIWFHSQEFIVDDNLSMGSLSNGLMKESSIKVIRLVGWMVSLPLSSWIK